MVHYDFETMLNRWGTGSTKWEEMAQYGITPDQGIIPMSNAEMEFYNPPEVIEGLKEFLDKTVLAYFRPMDSYYDAIIDWMKIRFDWQIEKEWICPFPGVHGALASILRAMTEKGDGVIVMEPTWPGFFHVLEQNGRVCVNSPLLCDEASFTYHIDFKDLEIKASDPNNKMIFFCSPHNPVGRVWNREELQRVAEICIANNVIIVSDELHADLIMPGYRHTVLASLSQEIQRHTITCTAPSKTFNLAGLCTSNIIISDPLLRDRFNQRKSADGIIRPAMLGMKACELAYSHGGKWLDACIQVLDENRRYVTEFLTEKLPCIRATPLEGSYLMWMDLRPLGLPYRELEKQLMAKAKVFFDDGYYFGKAGEGFVRVNIACPKAAVVDAMERLYKWVSTLEKSEKQ